MDIKPCPFCGCTECYVGKTEYNWQFYCVACPDCDAEGPSRSEEKDEAITLWNNRVNQ